MQSIWKSFKSYGSYNKNLKGFLAMKTINFDHENLPILLTLKIYLHNVLIDDYVVKIGNDNNPPYGI